MFEKLVESTSGNHTGRGKFLVSVLVVVAFFSASAVIWSLFAKEIKMGDGDFALSTLVAPLAVRDNAPEPVAEPPNNRQPSVPTAVAARRTNTLRVEESPLVPRNVSVTPNPGRSRPDDYFELTEGIETDAAGPSGRLERSGTSLTGGSGSGLVPDNETKLKEKVGAEIAPPPPLKKETPAKTVITTGGVVNGKATFLPPPPYPAPAAAVGASGTVSVRVLIDEKGDVASAKADSGHPLLRDAAEKAARRAKFSPTLLSGQPVKVNGVIVYNFKRN